MREPNKNKVYDLSELTNDELKEIANYMQSNQGWEYQVPHTDLYFSNEDGWLYNMVNKVTDMTNAKELFYTLENIQVDCRELSEEQIKEMAGVFENAGYKAWDDPNALKKIHDDDDYLRLDWVNDFYINFKSDTKTTINYNKFMELFGRKEENFKKLVGVLNEELTEKAYKETANKLNYELDFNFITQLAERMAQNKHKYEPYNWQKLDNIEDLKQALFRHVLEVMKGNYEDDKRLFGHLESIALNCMFINYQLNKHNEK